MISEEQLVLARLGDNLRLRQALRRVTQEELEFRAELHRTHVALIETGQRCPQIPTFMRLGGGLGVSPDDLLEGIAWQAGFLGHGVFAVSDDRAWPL